MDFCIDAGGQCPRDSELRARSSSRRAAYKTELHSKFPEIERFAGLPHRKSIRDRDHVCSCSGLHRKVDLLNLEHVGTARLFSIGDDAHW